MHRWLIHVVMIVVVAATGLLAMFAPAAAKQDPVKELDAVIAEYQQVLSALALANQLNPQELNALRGQLAGIYQDLGDLRALLATGEAKDGGTADETWVLYNDASLTVTPEGAKFTGWNNKSTIDMRWGNYGVVLLEIDNGYYQVRWEIRNAYKGNVDASVKSTTEGDVILRVDDEEGAHEFKIENGGTGPVYIRGRAGMDKQVSPVASSESTTAGPEVTKSAAPVPAAPNWYDQFYTMVKAGTIEESQAMKWFIDQYNAGEYVNAELNKLGSYLATIASTDPGGNIGTLAYLVSGERKEIEIADPRTDPATFAYVINKIFNMGSTGVPYTLNLTK